LLFFLIGNVSAEELLQVRYPEIGGETIEKISSTSLSQYIQYIFKFALWSIGIIAFFSLVYAGVLYLSSVGDSSKMKEAKERIVAVFLGIILLLSSYLILETVNPELLETKEVEIEKYEASSYKKPEVFATTTLINVELPIETMVKGVEDKKLGLFQEDRLEEIKSDSIAVAKKASESKKTSTKLVSLSNKCTCTHEEESCNGYTCTYPVCAGVCTLQTHEEEDPNNPGETITVEECKNIDCEGLCCTSDPCCCQRKEIDENKGKNRETVKDLQNLKRDLTLKKTEIEEEFEKIKKTLEIMKEDCLLNNVMARDGFIVKKGFVESSNLPWKVKEIKYWDEIENMIPTSYSDFYCLVGGSFKEGESLQYEMETEDISSAEENLQQYLEEGGGYNIMHDCPGPIPFGDVIDRGLSIANKLMNKISSEENADDSSAGCSCQGEDNDEEEEEISPNLKGKGLVELTLEMIKSIDSLHLEINKCLSGSCTPICDCDDSGCDCEPIYCIGGNPCPMGSINSALDEIKEIQKAIEKRKNEIVKIIDEEIPHYIEEDFDKMADSFHFCIANRLRLEEGWFTSSCVNSMGFIGPDGKILGPTKITDEYGEIPLVGGPGTILPDYCACSESNTCKEEFEHLVGNHQSCQIIEDCYEYNFFCCKTKD